MTAKRTAAARGGARGKDVFFLARHGERYGGEQGGELEAAFDALVSAGARMSGVFDADGRSPLMVAAAHANTRLMRLLLDKGRAPVDERSPEDGATALHCALSNYVVVEDPAAAALLLDAGADIEAREGNDLTPLAFSVSNHRVAPTRLLLDRGADVNRKVNAGYTPLILATEKAWLRDTHWPLLQEILRRSTPETRRAVGASDGHGAVDYLVRLLLDVIVTDSTTRGTPAAAELERGQERCRSAIAELLASGAPVRPENAERAAFAAGRGGAGFPLVFSV